MAFPVSSYLSVCFYFYLSCLLWVILESQNFNYLLFYCQSILNIFFLGICSWMVPAIHLLHETLKHVYYSTESGVYFFAESHLKKPNSFSLKRCHKSEINTRDQPIRILAIIHKLWLEWARWYSVVYVKHKEN